VAVTQNAIERVELTAERDLISVLGEQRTSRNVTYFVILYSAVLCILAAFRAHLRGVEYHLGRKYFLSGSQLRLVTGVEVVGVVVALMFVALFGRRSHKPILMFCGTLFCALGCFLCPVPYFVESARSGTPLQNMTIPTRDRLVAAAPSDTLSNYSTNYTSTPSTTTGSSSKLSPPVPDMVEYLLTELCPTSDPASTTDPPLTAWYGNPCVALNSTISTTYASLAYSLVSIGVLLHGLGTGLIIVTGFIYIDENALNKAVSVYFGELVFKPITILL